MNQNMMIALNSNFYLYDLVTDRVVMEYSNDSRIKTIINKVNLEYDSDHNLSLDQSSISTKSNQIVFGDQNGRVGIVDLNTNT